MFDLTWQDMVRMYIIGRHVWTVMEPLRPDCTVAPPELKEVVIRGIKITGKSVDYIVSTEAQPDYQVFVAEHRVAMNKEDGERQLEYAKNLYNAIHGIKEEEQ